MLGGDGRPIFFSDDEAEAWRVAHRLRDEPVVLYVDAGRAVRGGVAFERTRTGLFVSAGVPSRYVLNLQRGFREQISAGGFLVRDGRDGPEVALVLCRRSGGRTWEIAKGKLEEAESPREAAVRELQEEMGFEALTRVTARVGVARYGFRTPDGSPRLKTLHVYLLRADPVPERFLPARGEGIEDVRWFPLAEACRRVTHGSLRPLMARLREQFPAEADDAQAAR